MSKFISWLKEKVKKNLKRYLKWIRIQGRYSFTDRKKDQKNLCIILAGYKELLWEDIFTRIYQFAPKDMDICLMSAGKYSEKLASYAEQYQWSYLSTKKNKVTVIQNIALTLFPKAQMVYKIDEDIFVTKNFFKGLMDTYKQAEKESPYRVGFVAPLIPINGYAYIRVLEKVGLLDTFEKKFGQAKHNSDSNSIIFDPEVAKFMWGGLKSSKKQLGDIDHLDDELSKQPMTYSICSIRYSIGAILFKRELWENMGRFKRGYNVGMGLDETQLCNYLLADNRAIIVSENTLVGHFSYGKQTSVMNEFYKENRNVFKLK